MPSSCFASVTEFSEASENSITFSILIDAGSVSRWSPSSGRKAVEQPALLMCEAKFLGLVFSPSSKIAFPSYIQRFLNYIPILFVQLPRRFHPPIPCSHPLLPNSSRFSPLSSTSSHERAERCRRSLQIPSQMLRDFRNRQV